MKFAKMTREVERTIVPSLRDRADAIEKELREAWDEFIDSHAVVGVPRSHIEVWAWGEVAKHPGDRRNFYKGICWIADTNNPTEKE
jgi:hypothetical protein